jgi:hypothetical protein
MNSMNNINTMYKMYEMIPSLDTSKQLILEPLSCVLKIVILQWKPLGTKISISKNSLEFNEPSAIQGFTRRMTGDSRHDLHNICKPITKCLEWYPLSNPIYSLFYSECIKGLEILKSSYESNSIINHTLDHYIGILSGKDQEKIEDSAVIDGLKNMWTEKEIILLKTMVEHIVSLIDTSDKDMYLNVFEYLLTMKEQKVNKYIYTITTSY